MFKKLISILIVAILMFTFVGCEMNDSNKTSESENDSVESAAVSDVEKYNSAIDLIKKSNYSDAILLLEEIPDYKDSESLVGKVHYVYGSELFNEKDFAESYDQFSKASGYADVDEKKNMANYYAGVCFVNEEKHATAIQYFERALGTGYDEQAKKHLIAIYKQILQGVWRGTFVNDSGAQLQTTVHYYSSNNSFGIEYADVSSGYHFVSDMNGTLEVGAEYSILRIDGGRNKVRISISSISNMSIDCSDNEMLGRLINGSYTKKKSWTPDYEITGINYPTVTVPDFFGDTDANSENASGSSNNASARDQSGSRKDESSASKNESSVSVKDTSNKTNSSGNSKTEESSKNQTEYESSENSSTQSSDKEQMDAHIHNYADATCEKPFTCSCGATTGFAYGHQWQEATCEKPKTCYMCDKIEGSAKGHKYEESHPFRCSNCNGESPNALSILKNIKVTSVDPKVGILDYSVSDFSLYDAYGENGYIFDFNYEIECLSDFGTYQMNIVAFDANDNILSESYEMFNQYSGTLTAGEHKKLGMHYIIYSDAPIVRIEIG